MEDINLHIEDMQGRINSKGSKSRQIIRKLSKDKDKQRILKAAEKGLTSTRPTQ